MTWPDDPLELLAGPRGRRLCFEVVSPVRDRDVDAEPQCPGWFDVWMGSPVDQVQLAAELAAMIAVTDLRGIARSADRMRLLRPLAASVDEAMYWQGADSVDEALRSPALAEVLAPVAHAVSASPAVGWWSEPLDREQQRYTEPVLDSDPAGGSGAAPETPGLSGAASRIADWREDTLDDERRAAKRPADVTANYSGYWWSAPDSVLVSTRRSLPGLGSVELSLIEDAIGTSEAWCWPLRVEPGARVLEIRGPADWVALVARYPLDVTKSRRHDWWRVTGLTGTWLIPDYTAVAADYDAVHLTVGGYLTTAGRALPVQSGAAEARTMLAGWNPDQTYWLADMVEFSCPAVRWVSPEGDPLVWMPA